MSMKDALQTPQFRAQAAALAAAGWELEWDSLGWVTAVHPQYGRTPATYPRPGRGLKFAIVAIDRVHLEHGLPPIEVNYE
jgi:hypothetical protein